MIKGPTRRSCFFIQFLLPLAGERKFKTSKHTRSQCSENQGEGENADGEGRAKTEAQAERGDHKLLRLTWRGARFPWSGLWSLLDSPFSLAGAGGSPSREENVL